MLKKHFVFLVLMVMAIASANASTWKLHNCYQTSKIQNIFDTGDKVYYLNSGNLFRFDKATQVTEYLNKQNILSDNQISEIYYDWERKLLFIAYLNSNIDVIDSIGQVTNVSCIKDKVMDVHNYTLTSGVLTNYVGKVINDINFAKGKAYVAIGSGFVVIDESTFKVEQYYEYNYNISFNSVAMMGDTLLIMSNNRCYYGILGDADPIDTFSSITGSFTGRKMYPINDHSVFVFGNTNGLYRLDFSTGTPTLNTLGSLNITNVQKTPTGFIGNYAKGSSCFTMNADGTSVSQIASTATCASSDPFGDGTIWVTDANGLHIKGSTDYYKMNSLTFDAPHWLKYNAELNKLYVANSGPNQTSASSASVANYINTYDGVTWTDATAYAAAGAGYELVFDPNDQHTYYRTSWNKGIFKVTNDVMKSNYVTTNALINKYKPHPAFDKYGNLWVFNNMYGSGATAPACVVLTKDKLNKTPLAKADWFSPSSLPEIVTKTFQKSRFIVASKNNVKIFSDGDYPTGNVTGHMLCWDNENEDPTVDNYKYVSLLHFVDQNNKQIEWIYLSHFEEDKDGMIWAGHDQGLFMFDPEVVFDEVPRGYRPYVSKFSEGKGNLCEGYMVYDIGVDRDNNKWIASNNGLYYVSSDGSEVFNHFITENSDIPSNTVFSVECDTVNNRIFIFTDNGFAEYVPDGDAAALNFDNVYAFPDPVEPSFTGMIKITNLMENSYVTITDRNGAVVTQLGPVMGSAFWDGSGADGERVATGIYKIYAAQGAQPSTTGTPQATVRIIK